MATTIIKSLDHHALLILLLQLSVLLATARLLGEMMRRLHQPGVVGELLAGVLLGPTCLGLVFPELQTGIFPPVQAQADLLSVVAWLGALFLLVTTGLETDMGLIRQKGGTALLISVGGIILPFATGLGMGLLLPDAYLTSPDRRGIFALFMAVAMSISAVPVIAKVLLDLKLIRRDIGQLTLAAAMTDDTVGWILLSVVAGLAARGSFDASSVLTSVAGAVVFVGLGLTVGARVIGATFSLVDRFGAGATGQFSLLLVLAFGVASLTHALGIEAVLGAFVVGILAGQAKRFRSEVGHVLELMTVGFVAPIFFASAGLKVDLVRLFDPGVAFVGFIVLLIACIGKFAGCYLGAWAAGVSHWERLALGAGMNARGAMEIIVATVGLSLGVLTPEMYSVIVLVAIATSLMAPPLLRWTLSKVKMSPEEARRLESEAIAASSFVRSIRRVLVVAQDQEQASLASELLTSMKKVQAIELTAMYVNLDQQQVPWWRLWSSHQASWRFRESLGGVRQAFRRVEGRSIPIKVATGSHAAGDVLREAGRGYDLLVMAVRVEERPDGLLFGRVADRLVREAPCTTLVLQSGSKPRGEGSLRQILVPTTGTEHSRSAAEVAAVVAQGAAAKMTLVHVISTSDDVLTGDLIDPERAKEIAEDLVEQHLAVAKKLGAEASALIEQGPSPENVILTVAERTQADLIVLGTSSRGVRQRAYLGRRAEALLRSAPCAVAIVCTS